MDGISISNKNIFTKNIIGITPRISIPVVDTTNLAAHSDSYFNVKNQPPQQPLEIFKSASGDILYFKNMKLKKVNDNNFKPGTTNGNGIYTFDRSSDASAPKINILQYGLPMGYSLIRIATNGVQTVITQEKYKWIYDNDNGIIKFYNNNTGTLLPSDSEDKLFFSFYRYNIGTNDPSSVNIGIEDLNDVNTINFKSNTKIESDDSTGGIKITGGPLTIDSSLNIIGNTTKINTINLDISDNIITLNNPSDSTASFPPTSSSGIIIKNIESSTPKNAFIGYTDHKFQFGLTSNDGDTNVSIDPSKKKLTYDPSSGRLGGLMDPSGSDEAATKSYVDSKVSSSGDAAFIFDTNNKIKLATTIESSISDYKFDSKLNTFFQKIIDSYNNMELLGDPIKNDIIIDIYDPAWDMKWLPPHGNVSFNLKELYDKATMEDDDLDSKDERDVTNITDAPSSQIINHPGFNQNWGLKTGATSKSLSWTKPNSHDASLCSLIPNDICYDNGDVGDIIVPNDSAINSIWTDFKNNSPPVGIGNTLDERIQLTPDDVKLFNSDLLFSSKDVTSDPMRYNARNTRIGNNGIPNNGISAYITDKRHEIESTVWKPMPTSDTYGLFPLTIFLGNDNINGHFKDAFKTAFLDDLNKYLKITKDMRGPDLSDNILFTGSELGNEFKEFSTVYINESTSLLSSDSNPSQYISRRINKIPKIGDYKLDGSGIIQTLYQEIINTSTDSFAETRTAAKLWIYELWKFPGAVSLKIEEPTTMKNYSIYDIAYFGTGYNNQVTDFSSYMTQAPLHSVANHPIQQPQIQLVDKLIEELVKQIHLRLPRYAIAGIYYRSYFDVSNSDIVNAQKNLEIPGYEKAMGFPRRWLLPVDASSGTPLADKCFLRFKTKGLFKRMKL